MRYNEYKSTSNRFLTYIPSHWKMKFAKVCFDENKCKNINNAEKLLLQFKYGTIVHKAIQDADTISDDTYEKYTVVQPKDIVINGLNLNYDFVTKRIGMVKERGIITSAYLVVRNKALLTPEYSTYLMKSFDGQKVFHGMGSGLRLTLSFSDFAKMQFPIPPREEQDQIVRYLDWKVSQINKMIHGYQKQINLLEERKRTLIDKAVTKGINPNAEMKESGIYWIGKIPKNWNTISIFRLFTEVKNKNIGMQEKNLLSLSYGNIVRRNIEATEGLLPASFEGYNIIEKDDIVLRLTDLQNDHKSLRTGIAKERGIITSAYTTIRNKSKNLSLFLQLQLHAFDLEKGFYNVGASGVRQSLSWDTIKNLLLAIPSIPEQQAIVEYIETQTGKINFLKEKIAKQIELLKEYRTTLISDVVTGKIDVRNVNVPDYESESDDFENDDEEGDLDE